jgi:mutator protein MutT
MAGALVDAAGRILIAQRPAPKHMAGFWEFPGGKLELGEARGAGLARELREELGIEVIDAHPLIRLRHRYPDRHVLLDIWRVRAFGGEPTGRDGQALQWCEAEALPGANLLPADRPAITALRLPDCLDAAAHPGADGAEVAMSGSGLRGHWCADLAEARQAIAAGADFVALSHDLRADAVRALCEAINAPVYCRGVSLTQAWESGARGIVVGAWNGSVP